jgi:hypothetical protein
LDHPNSVKTPIVVETADGLLTVLLHNIGKRFVSNKKNKMKRAKPVPRLRLVLEEAARDAEIAELEGTKATAHAMLERTGDSASFWAISSRAVLRARRETKCLTAYREVSKRFQVRSFA